MWKLHRQLNLATVDPMRRVNPVLTQAPVLADVPFVNSSKQITPGANQSEQMGECGTYIHSVPISALSSGSLYTKYLAVCGEVPLPPSRQFRTCASCNGTGPMSARFVPHTGQLKSFKMHYQRTYGPRYSMHSLCQVADLRTGLPVSVSWARDREAPLIDNYAFNRVRPRGVEPVWHSCGDDLVARLTDPL